MLLAPFLLCLSFWQNSKANKKITAASNPAQKRTITIPWFAVLFIVTSGIHSLSLIPQGIIDFIVLIDNALLTLAMVALGLRTHIGAIRQAGIKPLLLASCLCLFLTLGGYVINLGIAGLF